MNDIPSLRVDLNRGWFVRSLLGSLVIPAFGTIIVGFFWSAFPPRGLSLAYGLGWVIATLALWFHTLRSPLDIHRRQEGILEIGPQGIRINDVLVPFSMIEHIQLGTSMIRKTDYQAILEWKRPQYVNGSIMGAQLYLWLKKDAELSTKERTGIFLLCPSSMLWGIVPAKYIILDESTFATPIRSIQAEIEKYLIPLGINS